MTQKQDKPGDLELANPETDKASLAEIKAYQKMANLCSDFVKVAKMCVLWIIGEHPTNPRDRTLKVKPVGGVAGGSKYIVCVF